MATGYLPPPYIHPACNPSFTVSPQLVAPGGTINAIMQVNVGGICGGLTGVMCSWADSGCTINGVFTSTPGAPIGPIFPDGAGIIAPFYYPIPFALPDGPHTLTVSFPISASAYGVFSPYTPYPGGCWVGVGNNLYGGWANFVPFNVIPQPEPTTCHI